MSCSPEESSETLWWVYVIETESGKLYTGITTDVERRFKEHCGVSNNSSSSKRGAKFFRSDKAKRVVYKENAPGRSEASRREAEIKKLSRSEKLWLIASTANSRC